MMKMPLIRVLGAVLVLAAAEARAQDMAAGEERYNVNCVNCHGKEGKGMASFPAIAGRDAAYIADRLTTYRSREMVGPNSALMMSLTGDLSDDDIADLAAYIATAFP